ncbi:hypothetical protein QFZ82_007798 [Streptomyces sp. V4I23]|uniref:hypothetical protein n=1 Tax=Streptomyces sp. V4I23 TaxID=3042282 RepID=UPI00278465AF|nr:hypothetical protein [Streptomyces sp. V4I23]MDQ1013313.1 hypothetical protein [Streptomyces sp. V4I23]
MPAPPTPGQHAAVLPRAALVFADVVDAEGRVVEVTPRHMLRQLVKRGPRTQVARESEFAGGGVGVLRTQVTDVDPQKEFARA